MISFDTNLLLYSLNQDCAEFKDARSFFDGLPAAPGTVAIYELVLVELYVLLRNSAVVKNPLDPADAVSLIEPFRQHPSWRLIDYPGQTSTVMDEVWRLALTLRHHGVTEFATRNETHFTGFGFTRLWNPLPA